VGRASDFSGADIGGAYLLGCYEFGFPFPRIVYTLFGLI